MTQLQTVINRLKSLIEMVYKKRIGLDINMMHYARYIVLFVLVTMPFTAALAADYTVRDVKVDVEAETALDARDKALNEARRSAYNVLVNRVTQGDQLESLPPADDRTIATMVDSFEINREKFSKNRYLASVNVAFNQNAVQSYLARFTQRRPHQQPQQGSEGQYSGRYGALNGESRYAGRGGYNQPNSLNSRLSPSENLQDSRAYSIQLSLSGLRQWVQIQNRLNQIGQVHLTSLSSRQAEINMAFSGNLSQLRTALSRYGMRLYAQNASRYVAGASQKASYILMVGG